MTGRGVAPIRVRAAHLEWLLKSLSDRDWRILEAAHRLRVATGLQLERLIFSELSGRSRSAKRGLVLKRLVDNRVLATFPRRVGGGLRGSGPLVYTLDSAGQWLMQIRTSRVTGQFKMRRRARPGERFIEHAVAIAELNVSLVEQERSGSVLLRTFVVEPRWPNGLGGWLAPDAFVMLAQGTVSDYWWCEIDMSTEDLTTTIRSKLKDYLDFLRRGQLGPDNIMPRVLWATLNAARRDAIRAEVAGLPEPAGRLFAVTTQEEAPCFLYQEVRQG